MSGLDLSILAAYAVFLIFIGMRSARGHQSADQFTLGGHQIPTWAVLCSMIATELSAATFIGVPQGAYAGDWSYLQLAVGSLIAKIWVARHVIPRYHARGIVTVYGFLTERYGESAGRAAAASFVVGRILASGARLFIAALAFSVMTEFSMSASIVLAGALAAAYTLAGGIRSVIYTDVLQGGVFLLAAAALLVTVLTIAPGGADGIWNWAQTHSRTQITHWEPFLSLSQSNAMGAALIGAFFLTLATHSTDHDMVQRLLTTRDGASGGRALLGSAWINFPMTLIFLMIGTGIAFIYSTDPSAPAADSTRILPLFAIHHLPTGVRGLVFAGLFAAAMSSLDSAICAIATTWVTDIRPRHNQGAPPSPGQLRWASAGISIVLVAAALGMATYHETLIAHPNAPNLVEFALGTMSILYGGLLGIFGVAFLTRNRGSQSSALAGLAVGTTSGLILFLHPLLLQGVWLAWTWWIPISATLAFAVTAARPRPSSSVGPNVDATYPEPRFKHNGPNRS